MIKNLKKIRVILFFNSYRGLEILKFLKKKKINISYIFLSKRYLNTKVLKYLKNKSFPYSIIKNLKSKFVYNKIGISSDLNIICGFPYIFQKKLINLNKYGTINCHAGKLPKYRGGSPLNWQMINNEKKIGLSIVKIDTGIDTGGIVNETSFVNKKKYTIQNLHLIANKIFPRLVYSSIKNVLLKKRLKKQSKNKSSYFKQRSARDSLIDLKTMTYKQLDCFVRALQDPYPNAYFRFNNLNIKIKKIKPKKIHLKAGKIKFVNKKIYLGCKNSATELTDYQISKI